MSSERTEEEKTQVGWRRNVATEAEMGVGQPQAKEPPEAGRQMGPWRFRRECGPDGGRVTSGCHISAIGSRPVLVICMVCLETNAHVRTFIDVILLMAK